jgi:hypothetical protein
VLVGRACGLLGDEAEAEMSFAGAATVFEQVGAGRELAQVRPAETRGSALA